MKEYTQLKKKLLKDKEVHKFYETLGPEYSFIEMIIRKRMELGFTQEDLARKVGTKQSAISRLESGRANPTVSFLRDVAEALGDKLRISL